MLAGAALALGSALTALLFIRAGDPETS
jgi:hypothetical protein